MRVPMRIPRRRRGQARGGGMMDMLKGRGLLIVAALLGLAFYWFSNQKPVGYTERRQVLTTSIEEENRMGLEAYRQILSEEQVLCAGGRTRCTEEDRFTVETLRNVGQKLAIAATSYEQELLAAGRPIQPKAASFDWQFNVIASDQPNAFCLPGGYVAFYTGILDVTGNYNQRFDPRGDLADLDKVAVVMGHEIAHALARHGGERMSQGKIIQMGQMAVGVAAGDQRAMQAFGLAAQTGVLLPFSRQHETEADYIGLHILARACYDPREAPELWIRMGELGGGQRPPEFMSTHPASERRAANFKEWMPEAIAVYEQRCGPLP